MDIFSRTVSCFLKELQWRLHKDEIIQGKFWLKFLYSNMWQNKQETVTVPNHFSRDDVIFKRIFSIYDADDTLIKKKYLLSESIWNKLCSGSKEYTTVPFNPASESSALTIAIIYEKKSPWMMKNLSITEKKNLIPAFIKKGIHYWPQIIQKPAMQFAE